MATQPLTSDRLEFDDESDAVEYYFAQGWTDGLPVVPPTAEKVRRFLECSDLAPSEILGTEPTKGMVITAEKVAINCVMAGCKPEYFPVVLAAVDAICEPQFNLHAITASTMGAAVLMVVNGPISDELGINSGVSVFGPGNRANATIGRALRLIISNVTGAVPGVLDKATLGHAGKYTWCIAEAEDVSPWRPLHVERGVSLDEGAITVFAGLSPTQVDFHASTDPEAILTRFSDAMFAMGHSQEEVLIVLCPEHVGHLKAAHWTKKNVREFLFETTHRKASEWVRLGAMRDGDIDGDENIPVALGPEGITIIVAGGPAGAFSAVVPLWGGGSNSRSVTKKIKRSSR